MRDKAFKTAEEETKKEIIQAIRILLVHGGSVVRRLADGEAEALLV